MKKLTLLFFLSAIQLFALNIILNSAKENGLPYAVLHIKDSEFIECKTIKLPLDKKSYICKVDKIVKTPLFKKDLRLVSIDFLEKKKEFYIKIDPKVYSRIIPINEYLYKKSEVTSELSHDKTHHWVILLFNQAPFGEREDEDGINFPVTYEKYIKPSIGAVDLNGAPISYAKSKDINYYLDIQKEFNNEDYESTIKDVDRVLKEYPHTIFKSELLLYKLRALDISINKNIAPISEEYTTSDILKLAKSWMKEFSSDENIPEVLYILAKNYLKSGSTSDANYFLDILVTEHENSKYTKKAILYFADSLFNKNEKEKAIKLYEDVLYSAKDMDIASEAAIRIAKSKISIGKSSEAKEYLQKVLKANKEYLLKDMDATHKLAKKLARNKLYETAANIADLLYSSIKDKYDERRELLLKESGDWYAKAGEINRAYERYTLYKKEYKDGNYIDEVNRALDELFFKLKDTNGTKLLKYYDTLIERYDDEIRDKAIIAKAKLLFKDKEYEKVLKMQNLLKEADDKNSTVTKELISKSALKLVGQLIKEDKCIDGIELIERYDVDIASCKDRDKLYECLIISSRYKKAEKLVLKGLNSKKLEDKFKWMQRALEVYSLMHRYEKVLELKKDLFTLAKILKKSIGAKYYRYVFEADFALEKYDEALDVAKILQKRYPKDIKNLEIYFKIVKYADKKEDDLLLAKYAKKILDMEKSFKVYPYRPDVEFLYIDALKRLNRLNDAKDIALSLVNDKISANIRVRAYYLLGEISYKQDKKEDAKEYFKKCVKIDVKSSWKSLCKDNLNLF